ncbi:MAG: signal peptide peptidase SppA [Rickettsiales bacterium]|nr:signal peptide peptidase SppA [Rickettsiales bacterium]
MALNADILLERIHLKAQARRWRLVALVVAVLAALMLFQKFGKGSGLPLTQDHIARVTLDEIIFDDTKRDELLTEIENDDTIKAVIVRVDSPGGTTVGSEEIYLRLREIAKKKPVAAAMRSFATSGGYMAAIGADYIVAREGTLTGSIGVIMQTAEMTELAKKIGITPIVVRSGDLKASPTPAEKMTPKVRKMLEGIIDDFFQYFIGLVKTRRGLDEVQVATISDGRVVSARQAIALNLVDEIGGEAELLKWLKAKHKVDEMLEIRDYEVPEEDSSLKDLLTGATAGTIFENLTSLPLDGLVSIWHPTALK